MGATNKDFLLFTIVLAGLTMIILPTFTLLSLSSASIPTPSVPNFTLKTVNASYNVPPTSSIDPYTVQTITRQGYHVDNVTLVMVIQNQPLVYQYNGHGFFYNVSVKGHYAENWTQLFPNDELPEADANSTQTLIPLGALTEAGLSLYHKSITIPKNGELDVQVDAMIGQVYKIGQPLGGWTFDGQRSGWSDIQTITVSNSSLPTSDTSPTPNSPDLSHSPIQTSIQPNVGFLGLDLFGIGILALLVVVVILLASVVFYLRKRK
jgi:hypothetical protein